MDDQDRGPDQNIPESEVKKPADQNTKGEGVPVPTRIRDAVDEVRRRVREEAEVGRDVVREYEERYYGARRKKRLETEESIQEPIEEAPKVKVPYKPKRRVSPEDVDANERKWAALAHASTLLTALVGLFSAGTGVLLTMFIPLLIYFSFRKRSEYVAFHALQAFAIQIIGTIGWLTLLIVGTVVWLALLLVSAFLILVLIGIALVPLVAVMYPIFLLASLALPFGMVIYSVIAFFETRNGHDYHMPYIARWVENQMYGGLLSSF
jgi:uncharacterized Tic20 family protein